MGEKEDKELQKHELSVKKNFINKYRVFPRLFSALFGYLLYICTVWFMALPTPTAEQAAFASTMVATAAAFFKFYVDSGPNKNRNSDEDE
jgi:hypothetical protein